MYTKTNKHRHTYTDQHTQMKTNIYKHRVSNKM